MIRRPPRSTLCPCTTLFRSLLYAAAALSLIAALTHAWAMLEHFEEWWGYGTFFVIAATAQACYGLVLLRWSGRSLLLLGVDRKSTRLNSSHANISYAVFCLN